MNSIINTMNKIFCICCDKYYREQYYNYNHIKSKKHLRLSEELKNKNIELVVEEKKEKSDFEKKLCMLNDINNLFKKYGEDTILKEFKLKEVVKEVIVEKKVLKIVYKSKEEDIKLIGDLKRQIEEMSKELEIIKNIDISDIIEEVIEENKKVCKKCGENKTLEEYYKEKRSEDGRRVNCIECEKKRRKEILSNKIREQIIEDEKIKMEELKKEEELRQIELEKEYVRQSEEEQKENDKVYSEKKRRFVDILKVEEKKVVEHKRVSRSWIEEKELTKKLGGLEKERSILLYKRMSEFYKCENGYEKTKCIKSYGEELDRLDTEINMLKREKYYVYVSMNGEKKLDREIRIMGYIMKERNVFLSGDKIVWDRERVENRYTIELGKLEQKINCMVGSKGDWLKNCM